MNKHTEHGKPEEHSLQKKEALPIEIRKLQSQLDELKDMADLLPVLASVQEHLEEEKQNHHKRMVFMTVMAAVLFILFLIAPIYLGNSMLKQSEAQLELQRDFQTQLIEKMEASGQDEVRAAREELAREKARIRANYQALIAEIDAVIEAQNVAP